MIRRVLLVAPAAVVLAALAGCAPLGLVLGGGPAPRATSTALPQPSRSPVTPARPTIGPAGCTLSNPGAYQVQDCPALILNGNGITVTAARAGSIEIRGDRNQVLADAGASVQIWGQDDQVVVGGDVGGIRIHGDRNEIDAQGRLGSGKISGNDNTVTAAAGVGDITDDGQRNAIGDQP